MAQNKKHKSIGSFTAVRKRTIDNAPTIPREITILDCTAKIIAAVIKANAAIEILKFGIDYNQKKAANIDFSSCYICNELGALKSFKDEDFYELIILADVETSDPEIKALISQLPRFNKH